MADTVKIRHAGFVYNKKNVGVGTDGKKTVTWHPVMAQRGEVVNVDDIHEADVEKGYDIGAFWTDEYDPESGVLRGFTHLDPRSFTDHEVELSDDEPDLNVDESTDAEIADWVKAHSVNEVLALATDPEKAARLLEGEEAASGQDPRKTLVEGLDKIIGA